MSQPEVNPMSQQTSDDGYRPAARAHPGHAEGTLTQVIEQQTARIPSSFFLVAAAGAMAASVAFEATGRVQASRFVGIWVLSLLIAGVYNKLVRTLSTS